MADKSENMKLKVWIQDNENVFLKSRLKQKNLLWGKFNTYEL